MQQLKHYIVIGNKKYGYTLQPKRSVTVLVCKDAGIENQYPNSELPQVLSNLPQLILKSLGEANTQSEVVRFRVTQEEKQQIAYNALSEGFDTISAYIRSKLL